MRPLYRWSCRCDDFEEIQVPGESTPANFVRWLPLAAMEAVHEQLRRAVADEDQAIGLENELDLSVAWLDLNCFCLKACIHFPTDCQASVGQGKGQRAAHGSPIIQLRPKSPTNHKRGVPKMPVFDASR